MNEGAPISGPWYQRSFVVQAYEMGPGGRVKLGGLLNYFQEAASEHAEKLGASVLHLVSKNLTWVLSRYHIQIYRYPLWKEPVQMSTWPSVQRGLFALREFEVKDQHGNLLAVATTSWMLLDVNIKKPVLLADHLPEYSKDPRRAIADAFGPLPRVEKIDLELPFRVQRRDLDWNKHVNNVVYVEWAVETAPQDVLENFEPAEIEADFRAEVLFGETILSRTEVVSLADGPVLAHQIIKEQDARELTRLRTRWKKL